VGDQVRDWAVATSDEVLFSYSKSEATPLTETPNLARWLWSSRSVLGNRATFGKSTYFDEGRPWWAWHQVALRRIESPLTITFGEIATHNHFVLDRGGKVFNRTSPVIKLSAHSSEDDHLGLLGLLNSSVACFWFQQVCHNKGGPGGGSSKDEKWHDFYAFNSTKVAEFPLVESRPVGLAREIDNLAQQVALSLPEGLMASQQLPTAVALKAASERVTSFRRNMISLQEELDWHCYRLYGLLTEPLESPDPPEVGLGERAFEIVMARRLEAGTSQTKWFEWLGIQPMTSLPLHWQATYRAIVEHRISLIENDRNIGLIESAGCKRRWESPPWQTLEQAALRNWLLDRLEAPALWPASADQPPQLMSVHRLADAVQRDAEFMQVAALYAGRADFQLPQLVSDLVAGEAVPFLPVLRYAETGLRKREQWEATWALQRHEDRIDTEMEAEAPGWREELQSQAVERLGSATTPEAMAWVEDQLAQEIARQKGERKDNEVGKIPVPPKYQSKDFLRADFWRLRGGLDVPKERWISYPGFERGADSSLPIAWAGWDHLQQAMALASYFIDMKEREGWSPERLQPLLAGLRELVPWLKQWHNEMNLDFGARMGDYYESFVADEARALQFTLDDLRAWKPPVSAAKRGRKKAA
jgi:hypothetical protein